MNRKHCFLFPAAVVAAFGLAPSPILSAQAFTLPQGVGAVTLAWQYVTFPGTFGGFMGNVQRRPDGATTICWGGSGTDMPRVTDLAPDGSVALELGLPDGIWTYRAYHLDWHSVALASCSCGW